MNRPWISPTRNGEFRAILDLQKLLNEAGQNVYLDGHFSPTTSRAVVAFQTANNLKPDSNVGPATWAVLDGAKLKPASKKKATPKASVKKEAAKKAPAKKKASK